MHKENNLVSYQEVKPIVPADFRTAMDYSLTIYKSGLAPHLKNPESVFLVIQTGASLGLAPPQALQSLTAFNGKVVLYANTMAGLARRSGLLEEMKEEVVYTEDDIVATCTIKRVNEPNHIVKKWSKKEAITAKKWDSSPPWRDYPVRMLELRARSFALRDAFPDVLMGLYTYEEMSDEVVDKNPKNSTSIKVILCEVDNKESITVEKEKVFDFIKDRLSAIDSHEKYIAYKEWSKLNNAVFKDIILNDSREHKELKKLFYDKRMSFESPSKSGSMDQELDQDAEI